MQGVGFRMFVQSTARRLGLTGWVRNDWSDERRVELVAEGGHRALENLLEAVRQGPPGARVENVEAGWEAAQATFQSFHIRYDY